ncbi:hypothetical protein, partial [Picosynechococcus sp. NKBG15041c]|uniref:hypothetical protein n=1 Tax=Picosynechococcus sp. NKBG15041c TaxID=1407650 RepID=UPI00056DEE59
KQLVCIVSRGMSNMDSQITSKYFVSSDRIKSELASVETPVDWQRLVDKKILEQKEKINSS